MQVYDNEMLERKIVVKKQVMFNQLVFPMQHLWDKKLRSGLDFSVVRFMGS